MIVVGMKEKEAIETILPDCVPELQEIYTRAKEGNGQRWLMIDLEDEGQMVNDLFRFMDIRRG